MELQVNFELAYINTNHEDFIGFHNASSSEKSKKKTGMNQVIRRGYMSIDTGGGIKKMKGSAIIKENIFLTRLRKSVLVRAKCGELQLV